MIAMLGMYDLPIMQRVNDRFWRDIRSFLGFGPDHLTRDRDYWDMWQSPDLVFAQTCGMPFRTRLHDKVQYIGTPDYGLEGCPPGYYRSHLIARTDAPGDLADFAGKRFAYNESVSQSGWAAPMTHFAKGDLQMGELIATGAHINSARAVAEGRADLAAIDAQTWRLLSAHDPMTKSLRIVESTDPTPGLPFICASGQPRDKILTALGNTLDHLTKHDRTILGIRSVIQIPAQDYLSIPTPAGPMSQSD